MSGHAGRLKVGSPANWNIYTEEGFWTGTTTRIGHAGPANAAEIVRRWNAFDVFMAVHCSDPDHCSGPEGLNAKACGICRAQNAATSGAGTEDADAVKQP